MHEDCSVFDFKVEHVRAVSVCFGHRKYTLDQALCR